MKKLLLPLSLFFFLAACNNGDKQATAASENDVDAARNFIQAALNGDYQKARTYMLHDSLNLACLEQTERVNSRLSPEDKKGLAAASILIHSVSRPVPDSLATGPRDSLTYVVFSNSYKNNRDTLKVVKQNGNWLVDFAYLFTHDSDSLALPSRGRIDTISR